MTSYNTKPEIIDLYLGTFFDMISLKWCFWNYRRKIENTFKDSEGIITTLQNEVDKYLQNCKIELRVLKFMLKNEKKLYLNDIYDVLEMFDKNYEERYMFMQELIDNLQIALDLEFIYRFYMPKNKPKVLSEVDYGRYISYVKGFNINRVKNFLIDEGVYDEDTFDDALKHTKFLKVDAKDNLDMFGLFDKGLLIADVKDELSTLVAIHVFIHQALLNKRKDIADDDVSLGEEMSKFYEGLFKQESYFVDIELCFSDSVLEMLKDYKDEKFDDQIKKLKSIKAGKKL